MAAVLLVLLTLVPGARGGEASQVLEREPGIVAMQATSTRTPGTTQPTATPTPRSLAIPTHAAPDLRVINAPIQEQAVVGEKVSFYVGAWNRSTADDGMVGIMYTLSEGLELAGADVGSWSCTANRRCYLEVGLPAGQSSAFLIHTTVKDDAGNQVTNHVQILNEGRGDSDPGNDSLTRTLTVVRPAIIAIPTAT